VFVLRGRGLLTVLQRDMLEVVAGLPDQKDFYLTGGTALAEFYLGHRVSYDFDLFTAEGDLIVPFSHQLEAASARAGLRVSVTRRFATFVEFLATKAEETLRVDLALDTPFRFEPPVLSEYGIRVNSLRDLRSDKVLAYYGRAEPRDAVDLYFILQQEQLEPLLAQAARKDPGFDIYWMAVALNRATEFPDEPERWPVKMLREFDPRELKQEFRQLAMALMAEVTDTPRLETGDGSQPPS
jgi:hypothetical protein